MTVSMYFYAPKTDVAFPGDYRLCIFFLLYQWNSVAANTVFLVTSSQLYEMYEKLIKPLSTNKNNNIFLLYMGCQTWDAETVLIQYADAIFLPLNILLHS